MMGLGEKASRREASGVAFGYAKTREDAEFRRMRERY
jgi:hypothetical protein